MGFFTRFQKMVPEEAPAMTTCGLCGAHVTVSDTTDGRMLEIESADGRLRHRLDGIPRGTPYRFKYCARECLPEGNPNAQTMTLTVGVDNTVTWHPLGEHGVGVPAATEEPSAAL